MYQSTKGKQVIYEALLWKANPYANEVEGYVMNFSLSKDVKTNWARLKDGILKVGYQYFYRTCRWTWNANSFQCNAWFDGGCKARLKMYKLTKDKNEIALTLYQC